MKRVKAPAPLCEECEEEPADISIPNVEKTRHIPLCNACLKAIFMRVMGKHGVPAGEGATAQ